MRKPGKREGDGRQGARISPAGASAASQAWAGDRRPAASALRRRGRWGNDSGHERLRLGSHRERNRLSHLPAPRKQLLRRQSVPPRDLRYHGSRSQRLLDQPRLVVGRELPASAALRDHLDPTNRGPRLKHMVKLRHKPIFNQRSIIPRSTPSMEGGAETALTMNASIPRQNRAPATASSPAHEMHPFHCRCSARADSCERVRHLNSRADQAIPSGSRSLIPGRSRTRRARELRASP